MFAGLPQALFKKNTSLSEERIKKEVFGEQKKKMQKNAGNHRWERNLSQKCFPPQY